LHDSRRPGKLAPEEYQEEKAEGAERTEEKGGEGIGGVEGITEKRREEDN